MEPILQSLCQLYRANASQRIRAVSSDSLLLIVERKLLTLIFLEDALDYSKYKSGLDFVITIEV